MVQGDEKSMRRDGLGLMEALALGPGPGLISVVGGGGKTSLLFALAGLLEGGTVLTTTTRIFASQARRAGTVCSLGESGWEERLDRATGSVLVVGAMEDRHAMGVPASLPPRLLERAGVDWVVVEADGSRRLPVKAPAEHEPVVSPETTVLVTVAGIDALSAPIAQVAHRPERVSALTGLPEDRILTPEALGGLLASDQGGGKAAPASARRLILINKVESEAQRLHAGAIAHSALKESRVERVVAGALMGDSETGWQAWSR